MKNKKSKVKDRPEVQEDIKKEQPEILNADRTMALETELIERKRAEKKLIQTLDKVGRNRLAILNLMQDLKQEVAERKRTEAELKTERNLLRTVIDNIPDTIYFLDREGRKQLANKADLEVVRDFHKGEIIGKTDLELYPGEKGEIFHKKNMHVMDSGQSLVDTEELFQGASGESRWLQSSYYPMTDGNGIIVGLVGIGHDITERKRSAEALNESYTLNETILKTIPFGMDIVDADGTILFQNEGMIGIFGAAGKNTKCWELYRKDGTQCIDCPLKPGISIGDTSLYESHGIEGNRIFQISHTGMIFQGKKAMLEIFQDVTDRKKMEEKVIESEAYYRSLIDTSPDGIIISDNEGTIRYASKRTLEMFLIENSSEVIGTSILDWVDRSEQKEFARQIADILASNMHSDLKEYRLMNRKGSFFWGEVTSSPLQVINGISSGLLMIIRDISGRKQAENDLKLARDKAEESDKLKTAFLHNISHEIRTPMNAIVGFSALLTEKEVETALRDSYVEVILNSSDHLLSIINDIIDISNIEANIVKINKQEVAINDLIRSLYKQFEIKTKGKGIGLSFTAGLPDDEAIVMTDPTKLQQVLINLLNNASKFTSSGGIRFGYKLQDNFVCFFVNDSGIGIPEEHQKKIFDRFYQVENPVTKLYEGTGLGLAISKAYTELLGGSISLKSKSGQGSEFYFKIPYERALRKNESPYHDTGGKVQAFVKPLRILIAEDIDSNFKLLTYLLAGTNSEFIRAANGKEAVEKALSEKNLDLILMDIKMPVMDGFTATKLIRESNKTIPIIAQTAYVDDKEKALEYGCSAFIAKPFDRKSLIRIISENI
jgi:PAS domain S-box-containing protein